MSSINQHPLSPGEEDREIFLLFELEDMMYAIDCEKIREIVPLVTLKTLSGKGDTFAGFFNYRGQVVSVIDLCRMLTGRACRRRLSTRIILTEFTFHDGEPCILGLMIEGVTEIIRKERKAFLSSNMASPPYMRGIMMENNKIIQYIDIKSLTACVNVIPLVQNADVSETC